MENSPLPASTILPLRKKESSIGRLLLESGKIKPEDADSILRLQVERGLRFGDAAIQLGLATEDDILRALSRQFDYSCLPADSQAVDPEVVAAFRPYDPELEALRVLRSQISLRWFSEHKALVITAPRRGQGTSYVAANLAVVFSQLGASTLLIDANMRMPRQHTLFRLSNRKGFADILAGHADQSTISAIEGLENLSVLVSGTVPPNPLELIGRPALADLIIKLKLQYDIILIDAPPALDSADAQTLCARIGGALIVTRRHQTRIADVDAVKQQLAVAGAEAVGAVLSEF